MKKVLVSAMLCVASMSVFAKGSSHVQDGADVGNMGACMVQVDDAGSSRFINVNYIRAIEIIKDEKYNNYNTPADPKVVLIRMASNYSNRSFYGIAYPSQEEANKAIKELAVKINKCGR
jgi:hypothetical protein